MEGWIDRIDSLSSIADLSVDKYLADPVGNMMIANRALGVDCMIKPIIPESRDQMRNAGYHSRRFMDVEPADLFADAQKLPETRSRVVAGLDPAQIENEYRDLITGWLRDIGDDISPMTTIWESATVARARNEILTRLIAEYDLALVANDPNIVRFGALYVPGDPLFGEPSGVEPSTRYWGFETIDKTRPGDQRPDPDVEAIDFEFGSVS